MLIVFTFSIIGEDKPAFKPNINVENVILPCSNNSDSKSTMVSSSCKGEIRHCGHGKWRCIRVDWGIWACCNQYPENCPGIEEQLEQL